MASVDRYSQDLQDKANRAMQNAIDVLRGGAQPVHRVYASSKGITEGDSLFEGMTNMVPVVYLEDFYIRYVDPYVGSNRNESSPIAASYVTMTMQGGISTINFNNKLFKGDMIKEIDIARLHEVDDKVQPSYMLKYGNCRVVYVAELLFDNIWLDTVIMEIGSVTKIHKPASLLGKLEGNKIANHNFLTGKAR